MNNLNNEGQNNEVDNILINQNRNNNNNQQINEGNLNFTSEEIYRISRDFFPSLLAICCLKTCSSYTENFCNDTLYMIIKFSLLFHSLFFLKSIIRIFIIYCNGKTLLKNTLVGMDYSFKICYCIFILYIYFQFIKLPQECFKLNTLATVTAFGIITLGMFDLIRLTFSFLLIIIGFPIMLYFFFQDPGGFFQRYGVDPDIIDNWPEIEATQENTTECVICSADILDKDRIMILNCPGRHYYHASCIKEWLKVKINCPVCRSTNVF